ncbi:MAG: copper resistance CopC family protein [Nocardioidaceae bacterium]
MPRRTLLRAIGGLLAALAVVLVWMSPASAHASLVSSNPKAGVVLQRAPAKVSFTFDEKLGTPAVIVVTGPDGTRVDHGPTHVAGTTADVAVSVAQKGSYDAAYRVVSADGHPVAGQVSFSYQSRGGNPGSAAGATGQTGLAGHAGHGNQSVGIGRGWIVGGLALTALVVGVGMVLLRPFGTEGREP